MDPDFDVVIIGAGAAGIAAAIELQSTNLKFLVLEARNRIGGRAYTDAETFTSMPVDLGASWIHSYGPNNILYNYHQSMNIAEEKKNRAYIRLYLDYDGTPFTNETLLQAQIIYNEINEHLERFYFDQNTNEDQSLEEVLQMKYKELIKKDGPVKRLVDLYLSGSEQYDGSDLQHLSVKYWGTGSGSGYDCSVLMGYGNLIQKIAHKHNLPIQLNTTVTEINTTDNNRIDIKTANDSTIISCRRLIITIPLGCLKKETILFEPPLPDWKRHAIQQMGMGLMNKLILQFPNHFWGDDVRVISHACNQRRGRFRFTICNPPPDNILIMFTTGSFACELELLTDTEILEEIMKFFRQIFPGRNIPNPINYKFTRWSQDPYSYGSYSNFAVHSGPHTIEQLAKPTSDGRVQWAGEHANIDDGTKDWSYACVHSAFQSGQRAAKAIQDELCS